LLDANAEDMHAARVADLPEAKLRRLELTDRSIRQLADGIRQVSALPDPVGLVTRDDTVESGLRVRKVRAPLGVVMMIYEARPGVTVDAFSLCFKAGNACVLKGGREAQRSNECLAELTHRVLRAHGADDTTAQALTLVTTSDRDAIKALLGLEGVVDLVIPRGGETLIRFVHEHARVPTIQHFQGVCHVYVDASADLDRALDMIATAKTSAPATCNATECALVHESIADRLLPRLIDRADRDGFEIRGDERVLAHANGSAHVVPATDDDWGAEFLDLVLAVRVVPTLDDAIDHIARHGSLHSESVVAQDQGVIEAFTRRVDASCVLINASTRFNDGFQLGLGAEIGISTSKIHAFGPMGLEELTTQRWVVTGDGHTR
ncbi:MAG: glutamate-5-semialdehyde dehydrogenase, partial [Planctomycetota bacterium]